jgi:caspase 7
MKHANRGKCIILNHKNYDPKCQLNERKGTEADAKALYNCFRLLDFDVILYDDTNASDIISILDKGLTLDNSFMIFICYRLSLYFDNSIKG